MNEEPDSVMHPRPPRQTAAQLRFLLDALPHLGVTGDRTTLLAELTALHRNLQPEHEFALILSWLGRCQLIHKLGQEQLPHTSIDTYRVPDLLVVFEYDGRPIPVLIEVKTTAPPNDPLAMGRLTTIKPGHFRYAELLGLPLLIAWKDRTFWTLFEARHATLAETNYHIDFSKAFEENLLSTLAGDFSYRLAPGTALNMPIRKLTTPDPETGAFDGQFHDIHFTNPSGERIPNIRHLGSLFMFWENEAEQIDQGEDILQRFVVPNIERNEFASRTLSSIAHAFARNRNVDWRMLMHDTEHVAHDYGRMQELAEHGAAHGVITHILHFRPQHIPDFLLRE
jgi:hypothetical protein